MTLRTGKRKRAGSLSADLECEPDIRAGLLQSALAQFATEAIEPACQFVLDTPLDPDVLEVGVARLTGLGADRARAFARRQ